MSVKNGESETDSNIGEFLFSQAKYDTIAWACDYIFTKHR
jgi:hypothetical protein